MAADEPKAMKQLPLDRPGQPDRRTGTLERAPEELLSGLTEWEEIFDSISDAITIHARDFRILRLNKAAQRMFGLPSAGLSEEKCYRLCHFADSPPQDCPCLELFRTGTAASVEKFEPRLNKYVEIKVFPLFNQDAEIGKVVHIVRDITDRKQLEHGLRDSEEKYRSLVETTDDSIYIVDKDTRYVFINKKHLSRLGISNDAYFGRSYAEYHSPEETKWFTQKVREVFQNARSYQSEHMSRRNNNHFLLTFSPIRSADGTICAASIISKNITEFKGMQDKLRRLALTDDLTGLYNRRGFFSLAEHQLKMAGRMEKGLFLFYADIDNLKQINDEFGHFEGDQLIKRTASILKDSFRNSDIIARIGGDEFVIFPVEAEEGTTEVILARLKDQMERMSREITGRYSISLSVGSAYYDPTDPCSIEELLNRADMAMYRWKVNKTGRLPI